MQDLPVPTLKNHIVSDHLPQLRRLLDVKRALAYYSLSHIYVPDTYDTTLVTGTE